MKEFIKDVLIALVIVVVITLIIKPTIVKESSMESTLYENNYLFVNKLAYLTADHPDYGDIIVFKSHIQRDDGKGDKLLIKRVIGVENDVIDIHDGVVYRNGTALDEPYTKEGYTEGDISDYKVPADQVFVMGDNRRVSLDSRSEEVGTVSEDSIVGKAFTGCIRSIRSSCCKQNASRGDRGYPFGVQPLHKLTPDALHKNQGGSFYVEADRGIRYGSDHGDRLCCRIFRRVYDHDGDGKRDGAFL